MWVQIPPRPPNFRMPENYQLLDKEHNYVYSSGNNAACFASMRAQSKACKESKYVKIIGGNAQLPVSKSNQKEFAPLVQAFKELLKIEIIQDEKDFSYKIDLEEYPADVVMSFLRCMSIIYEGNTASFCMELYHAIVAKKLRPTVAAVACVLIGALGGNKHSIGVTTSRYATNHCPVFDDNVTVKTFRDLQTGEWKLNPKQKSIVEQGGYLYGYSTLIGDYQIINDHNDFSVRVQRSKMKNAKFHPLEIPVLYLLQFKYGHMCTMDQYVSSLVELTLCNVYNSNSDWLYYVNNGLKENNW